MIMDSLDLSLSFHLTNLCALWYFRPWCVSSSWHCFWASQHSTRRLLWMTQASALPKMIRRLHFTGTSLLTNASLLKMIPELPTPLGASTVAMNSSTITAVVAAFESRESAPVSWMTGWFITTIAGSWRYVATYLTGLPQGSKLYVLGLNSSWISVVVVAF